MHDDNDRDTPGDSHGNEVLMRSSLNLLTGHNFPPNKELSVLWMFNGNRCECLLP